ncbi:MAG: hypothetical protein ACXWPJ_03965 [Candidatus Limnocylindrales bacterium]
MSTRLRLARPAPPSWLRPLRIAYVPGPTTPLLREFGERLGLAFEAAGHTLSDRPNDATDLLIGTAPFGEAISWRASLLFTGRARFHLGRQPAVFALAHATPAALQEHLERLARGLALPEPSPAAFDFPGLAPTGFEVLYEQGRRGGPILALERLLQAQSKYIRIALVVGDERPESAYLFDLVGAHPRIAMRDEDDFYAELATRMATIVGTDEAVHHELLPEPIDAATWADLRGPAAMVAASHELGLRDVFTEPVRIARLVPIPAITDVVASQYSEGCFGTWEPALDGLLVTVTGSARPIDKGRLTEADLAVVSGIRPDGSGALARRVEGRPYAPPSSEAVEMLEVDGPHPRLRLDPAWGVGSPVPVVRSKLHAHRGIRRFDRDLVEYVPLEAVYHHYLVACASQAQAHAVTRAFAASETLRDPDDPRSVALTVLPGHGLMALEKWVAGTHPLETIWRLLDRGALELDSRVPQGPFEFVPGAGRFMELRVADD